MEDIIAHSRPDYTRSHQEYQLFFQLLPLDLNAVRKKEAAALNEPPLGYVDWTHKTNLSHNVFFFPHRVGQVSFILKLSNLFDSFYRIYDTHI